PWPGIYGVQYVVQCASAHTGSSGRPSSRLAPAAMRVAVTTLRGGAPAGPPGEGGAPVLWAAAASGTPAQTHHTRRFRRTTASSPTLPLPRAAPRDRGR